MDFTTIAVKPLVRDELLRLKHHERESYNDVIERLLKNNCEGCNVSK